MTPRPNAARIGLFALGGLALLIAAVVVVFGGRLFAATEQAVMHFRGSVYGLQVGSPVVFRGVRLGSVRSVGVVYAQGRFAVPVEVELDPAQIGTLGASAASDAALSLSTLLEQGLTGQLATHSLLTGQLYIDLDLRPGLVPAAPVARDAQGHATVNGARRGIAGIIGGPARNVVGLMPHPERRSADTLGGVDGLALFRGLLGGASEGSAS